LLFLVGGCVAAVGPAYAGNDDEILVGNQASMTGGAVSAVVADSSATWYNPAGLGAVDADQIDVNGSCYTLRSYSAPGFITSTTGEEHAASVTEFVSMPTQVAYVRRLTENLTLGLGYFVPQASNLILRESLFLEQQGLASGWQLTLSQVRVQHTGALALGFALSSRVRMGVSLVGTYQEDTQAVSIVGLQGPVEAEEEGTQQVAVFSTLLATATQVGMEIGMGLQIELGSRWRLGVTLRTPRLQFYQAEEVSGSTAVASTLGEPGINGAIIEPGDTRIDVDMIRAGRFGAALAWRGAGGDWLALELDAQPGVSSAPADVKRQTVLNARLGGYHRLSETLALGAGLFTDRSPDKPVADPISAYGDFYGGTVGLEYSDRHRLAQGERFESLSFSTTFALRYAFSDATINDLTVDPNDIANFTAQRGQLLVHEATAYIGAGVSF
jgi:hypothetical protein